VVSSTGFSLLSDQASLIRSIATVHTNSEPVYGRGATRLDSSFRRWRRLELASIERASIHDIDVLEDVGHPARLPVVGRPDNHGAIKSLVNGFA
jgi:hypothetical protein